MPKNDDEKYELLKQRSDFLIKEMYDIYRNMEKITEIQSMFHENIEHIKKKISSIEEILKQEQSGEE